MVRSDQDVVAGNQVHHPQERRTRHIARQAADLARLQVDDERIAEALRHERHALIIRRDVGTLAEVSQRFDVCRQLVELTAGLRCANRGSAARTK
jgi:hypothetical protein